MNDLDSLLADLGVQSKVPAPLEHTLSTVRPNPLPDSSNTARTAPVAPGNYVPHSHVGSFDQTVAIPRSVQVSSAPKKVNELDALLTELTVQVEEKNEAAATNGRLSAAMTELSAAVNSSPFVSSPLDMGGSILSPLKSAVQSTFEGAGLSTPAFHEAKELPAPSTAIVQPVLPNSSLNGSPPMFFAHSTNSVQKQASLNPAIATVQFSNANQALPRQSVMENFNVVPPPPLRISTAIDSSIPVQTAPQLLAAISAISQSNSTAPVELERLMHQLQTIIQQNGHSGPKSPDPAPQLPQVIDLKPSFPPNLSVTPSAARQTLAPINHSSASNIDVGKCASCSESIPSNASKVAALGRVWHREHFLCTVCRMPLSERSFFENKNQVYCEKDYHALFSLRCAFCNDIVKDRCINALGKSWHVDHFFCSQCGKTFADGKFMEHEGKAYCDEDYYTMFAPKCGSCELPIMQDAVTALGKRWHPLCFVCSDCKKGFDNGTFFDHEGRPYCEQHYHEQRGSLCSSCQKPISGRCLTALGRRFHPEHFTCSYCTKSLEKTAFREENKKPYCVNCHIKLFG